MNKKTIIITCGFILFLVAIKILFYPGDVEKHVNLPSIKSVVGQNIIAGIMGKTLDAKTIEILEIMKPAGVILYYRNYETPDDLKKLIEKLQMIAKKTTGYPYFIMIDEEPGGATRLDLFKNVFDSGEPDWEHIENDIKTMSIIGINVDLAPIADYCFIEDSFIKKRMQAHNPKALMDFNKKFIALLHKNRIFATLKHFPGMGVFIDDPHYKLPIIKDRTSYIEDSLKIFKDGIENNADFVMTGHGVYDDIDPGTPATLSKKITKDLLRNKLKFKGLAITDDLSDMIACKSKNELSGNAVKALYAGHNLLLFSHKLDNTLQIFNNITLLAQKDNNLKRILEQNYFDVIRVKRNITY